MQYLFHFIDMENVCDAYLDLQFNPFLILINIEIENVYDDESVLPDSIHTLNQPDIFAPALNHARCNYKH